MRSPGAGAGSSRGHRTLRMGGLLGSCGAPKPRRPCLPVRPPQSCWKPGGARRRGSPAQGAPRTWTVGRVTATLLRSWTRKQGPGLGLGVQATNYLPSAIPATHSFLGFRRPGGELSRTSPQDLSVTAFQTPRGSPGMMVAFLGWAGLVGSLG